MILVLTPNTDHTGKPFASLMQHLQTLHNIEARVHRVTGSQVVVTEIYLIGDTQALDGEEMAELPCVDRVVRISDPYKILGRHHDQQTSLDFTYNGVRFNQDSFNLFAGLCAVDDRKNVETMMRTLQAHGQVCTRMGAYKPRTSPYAFQGHGSECLPFVFELAGQYGIRVIAMEVTHEKQIAEIDQALADSGQATGVMLQIGTRNSQNFELLKAVGRQNRYPILIKRGFGISLDESLNAAEYLASEGNNRIVFCLRGMKTSLGDPHRNFVDFSHVPVVKRLTRMPVCVDPSHSVGGRNPGPNGLLDVFDVTAQGIVAGANMALVDFHPAPAEALVDGPQALRLEEFEHFLEDVRIAREAFERRSELAKTYQSPAS